MKRFLLIVAVLMATVAVKAQGIYVGGSFNAWRNSTENTTNFTIAPEIGYNFDETWAVGGELAYGHQYVKGLKSNSFAIAPYIRWSYYQNKAVRLFLDGTAGIGFTKVKGFDAEKAGMIGLRPGIALNLNHHFGFVAKVGFLGYKKNVHTKGDSFGMNLDSEDLTIGFHYEF